MVQLTGRIKAYTLFAGMALFGLAGCSGGGSSSPGAPVSVTLSATTATLTTGTQRAFTATVAGSTNSTVTWSVQEGAAGGTVDSMGAYVAPATAGTYHLVATAAADTARSATAALTVVPPPAIVLFSADQPELLGGGTALLSAAFTGGTGQIDHGVGTVASGAPAPVTPGATTVYVLTVTNAAGTSVSSGLEVKVDGAVSVLVSPASVTLPAGGTFTFAGASVGSSDPGVSWYVLDAGTITQGGVYTAPALPGIYHVQATSRFTATAQAVATVTVENTAMATVTAQPYVTKGAEAIASVTPQAGMSYLWTIAGAGGSLLSPANASSVIYQGVTSGASLYLTCLVTDGTYTAVGTGSTWVADPPVITQFTVDKAGVTLGTGTILHPDFTGNTATITGIGPNPTSIIGGQPYPTGNLNADTVFTLTARNVAGDTVSASLTVHAVPATFTATGSLLAGRTGASTTLLPDGRVLVAGGFDAQFNRLKTAELYDPATGLFTATAGPMVAARDLAEAVLLPSGKVFLHGGGTNQSETFDPATGLFTATATSNGSDEGADAFLMATGLVFNAGGGMGYGQEYDPRTDTFTNLTFPGGGPWQAGGSASVRLQNGKILTESGANSSTGPLSDVWLLDPAATTPVSVAFQPRPRANLKAVVLKDGKVLTAGGGAGIGPFYAGGELFDPALATFSLTGFMTTERYNHGLSLLPDGRALVTGGFTGTALLNGCEVYDETLNAFAVTVSFPDGPRQLLRPLLLASGKTLIAGGGPDPKLSYLYDPGTAQPSVAAFNATVTAPASVAAGQTGLTASVPVTAGGFYVWYLQGGTITAGQGTSTLTFTAGASGTLTLKCLVTNPWGIPALGTVVRTIP